MISYWREDKGACMTDARESITRRLKETNRSMKWLSAKLGRNPAYIQQFVERGSPRDLSLEMKVKIAEILDMTLQDLGAEGYDVRPRPAFDDLHGDATPYDPPASSLLARHPGVGYYRITSDVLARHPLRIQPGDIVAFDLSPEAVDNLRTEQIVLAEICGQENPEKSRIVVREYVRPGLLVTNRESENEVLTLGDPSAPYEVRIRGVFKTMIRE